MNNRNGIQKGVILSVFLFMSLLSYAISPEQAATTVQASIGGRVLDVRASNEASRDVYLVKVITDDSRVVIIRVDQATGQIVP